MLPLLNLTNSNLIAPDALQGASSLVPEDSDALRGGFANVLQSTLQPAVLLPATAGEDLPTAGKLLPVTATAGEDLSTAGRLLPVTLSGADLRLDADIELSIGELDLALPGPGQPATADEAGAALPVPVTTTLPETGSELPANYGLPATVHVPPGPPVADSHESYMPMSAADDLADALQVPLAVSLPNAREPGNRPQERDRAIDSLTVQQRSMAAARERAVVPGLAAVVPDGQSAVAVRTATGIDNPAAQAAEREGRSADSLTLNRAPTEAVVSRDDIQRATRDDGLQAPRPVQAAAWQQGTVLPEVPADSSQRMQADISAALPRTVAATPSQTVAALPPAQSIDIPVQQSGWDNALADRVTMMANGKLQNAELRLSPAELGPLRIQLEIDDGVANVSFQSQHPLTRDALEQAMPRLRELLAENGLSLGQADVGDDRNEQKSREALADGRSTAAGAGDDGNLTDAASVAPRVSDGLVDTFA